VRAPFLDHSFIGYIARLPPGLKLRGLTTKYVLKRAMRGLLPRRIISRRKKGFGIPVAKWLKGDLRELVRDTLSAERLGQQGLFNPGYVRQLMAEHERGAADHRKLLWTLLMFELWPGMH